MALFFEKPSRRIELALYVTVQAIRTVINATLKVGGARRASRRVAQRISVAIAQSRALCTRQRRARIKELELRGVVNVATGCLGGGAGATRSDRTRAAAGGGESPHPSCIRQNESGPCESHGELPSLRLGDVRWGSRMFSLGVGWHHRAAEGTCTSALLTVYELTRTRTRTVLCRQLSHAPARSPSP